MRSSLFVAVIKPHGPKMRRTERINITLRSEDEMRDKHRMGWWQIKLGGLILCGTNYYPTVRRRNARQTQDAVMANKKIALSENLIHGLWHFI
jgi:hypothetical protein